MRITFDTAGLRIVGFLRTRRIPRSAVLSVERWDLAMPLVQWSMPGASDRWSVLTPLMLNSSPFLPASMYRRRHRFLARLRSWAPDMDVADIRPGVWSQVFDGLARVVLVIARSPALRVAVGIMLLGVAVWAYGLGWATMLDVLQGSYRPSARGWLGALALSAIAAESTYWVLPLKTRRPRAWHIALGVLMAPLTVLTLIALVS